MTRSRAKENPIQTSSNYGLSSSEVEKEIKAKHEAAVQARKIAKKIDLVLFRIISKEAEKRGDRKKIFINRRKNFLNVYIPRLKKGIFTQLRQLKKVLNWLIQAEKNPKMRSLIYEIKRSSHVDLSHLFFLMRVYSERQLSVYLEEIEWLFSRNNPELEFSRAETVRVLASKFDKKIDLVVRELKRISERKMASPAAKTYKPFLGGTKTAYPWWRASKHPYSERKGACL